jgi:hypothetical protein
VVHSRHVSPKSEKIQGPIVRVVGPEPTAEIFVSVERMPLVLAELRRKLPKLKTDLLRKWPVESVSLEARNSRRRNPYNPSELVVPACVGIVVYYVIKPAVKSASTRIGEKVGDAIGEELAAYVRRWLKSINITRRKK